MRKIYTILILLTALNITVAQNMSNIEDSNKVNTLKELAWNYRSTNIDTALVLINHALLLAEKIKWEAGIGACYNCLGSLYFIKTNYSGALESYNKAMDSWKKLLSQNSNHSYIIKKTLATVNNMGALYSSMGNYPKAVEYLLVSLKSAEEIKDSLILTQTLGNLGNIYVFMNDYDKAIEYYLKSLKIDEQTGDSILMAKDYAQLGIAYNNKQDYIKSLDYFNKALNIHEKLGNTIEMADIYSNMGVAYADMEDYTSALDYYNKTMAIYEQFDIKEGLALTYANIGSVYRYKKEYKTAEMWLLKGLAITDSLDAPDMLQSNHLELSELYEITHEYAKALEHYKKAVNIKDALFNQEKDKEIAQKIFTYEFDKKAAAAAAAHQKELAVKEEKYKNERMLSIFGACLALLAGFGYFIYERKRRKAAFDRKVAQVSNEINRLKLNPHFIKNTIDFIDVYYIRNNDNVNASVYVNKLQKLMKLILENSDKEEIRLEQEIEVLGLYADLMNLKTQNKVKCTIECDHNIDPEQIMVPSTLIQPLIENAFKYAFSGIENPKLEVRYTLKDEMLYCTVSDNGNGIKQSGEIVYDLKKNQTGIGIRLIKERIEILNKLRKSKGFVTISDLKGEKDLHGTKIELMFPVSFAY
ncbi:MAG TPA: tetratricopeptide repeat protein [Bacteroidales bacterium]|nr:tetratricopeptide repeat protein [Bacteroidales bacterium]